MSVSDDHRVTNSALETGIDTLIEEDRRITIALMGEEIKISVDTVHNIVIEKLKYCKTIARLVSRELTNHRKRLDFECT